MNRTWRVVYRTGGTERCQWRRTIAYQSRQEADTAREETERMGYKALTVDYQRSLAIGLPEGWEA